MAKAKPNAKAPVGQGGRFAALTQKLEGQGKSAESARKIAAFVGREKYGNSRMQRMSAAGRKKK